MTAEVDRPDETANGVLVAYGSQNTGFSWYIKDEQLVFDSNVFADRHVVRSTRKEPVGRSSIGVEFSWTSKKGTIALLIEGSECRSIDVPSTVRGSSLGMSIGRDSLSPVTDDYVAPFPFSGTIRRLEVEVQPLQSRTDERRDAESRLRPEMARQLGKKPVRACSKSPLIDL